MKRIFTLFLTFVVTLSGVLSLYAETEEVNQPTIASEETDIEGMNDVSEDTEENNAVDETEEDNNTDKTEETAKAEENEALEEDSESAKKIYPYSIFPNGGKYYSGEYVAENLGVGNQVVISATSRKHAIINTYSIKNELTEAEKQAFKTFFDKMNKFAENGSRTEAETTDKAVDYYANVKIINQFPKEIYDGQECITIRDNRLYAWGSEYIIDNPSEILDYMISAISNELTAVEDPPKTIPFRNWYKNFQYDDENYSETGKDGKPYRYVDKIEFDITLDDSYYDTPLAEVADSGEKIHVTLKNTRSRADALAVNVQNVFLLTFSGSKGEKTFFNNEFVWRRSASYPPLKFSAAYTMEGSDLVIKDELGKKYMYITVDKILNSAEYERHMKVCVNTGKAANDTFIQPNELIAENVKYFYNGSGDDMDFGLLMTLYSVNYMMTEDISVKSGELPESLEQRPWHYKTDMRGSEDDYKVDFVVQSKINVSPDDAPDWFSELGDNVKADIAVIDHFVSERYFESFTMVKFSGDEGSVWFEPSRMSPNEAMRKSEGYVSDEEIYVTMVYGRLLSFENWVKIKNDLEQEETTIRINLSNDGTLTLEGLTFEIGSESFEVGEEDMNYIGGSREAFESLFDYSRTS